MRKKTLNFFPFDDKQERVYRALLSLGDAPASFIARRAGVRRTSAYHILENLKQLGLASSYSASGVHRFVAEHPSRLKHFFERQVILAERMMHDFKKDMSSHSPLPSIRIFEGEEAVRGISEEALGAKQKTILTIGSTAKLLDLLGGKYGFGKRRRERGIFQRALRFASDEYVDRPERFHDVRILPSEFDFPGYILIFDDTVGIIPYEKPLRGIFIKSRGFSVMARSLFETLWNMSTRPPKD